MKNAVLTFVGLVGLSAAGGVALVASHTALAAGPRLPDHVVRAHAVAAAHSENEVAISLTAKDSHRLGIAEVETSTDVSDRLPDYVSTHGTITLAPVRTLRPVARADSDDSMPVILAQASPTQTRPAVTRQIQSTVPRPQRFVAVRQFFQPRTTRSAGTIKPGYMHGVFR